MYDDEYEVVGFVLLYILFIGILALILFWATADREPSRSVVQCVDTRMETLEGLDMWSGESERAEMAAALEDFCEEVQR